MAILKLMENTFLRNYSVPQMVGQLEVVPPYVYALRGTTLSRPTNYV